MTQTNLITIYQPQFVPNAAAGLIFAPVPAAGLAVVPALFNFLILTMRVTNVTAAPVPLTIWRVPAGAVNDNQHLVIPNTVNVPTATAATPWFDVGALWGALLQPGDAIWAVAGSANALSISGDGAIVQQ